LQARAAVLLQMMTHKRDAKKKMPARRAGSQAGTFGQKNLRQCRTLSRKERRRKQLIQITGGNKRGRARDKKGMDLCGNYVLVKNDNFDGYLSACGELIL
jgi:hypothetical protein